MPHTTNAKYSLKVHVLGGISLNGLMEIVIFE